MRIVILVKSDSGLETYQGSYSIIQKNDALGLILYAVKYEQDVFEQVAADTRYRDGIIECGDAGNSPDKINRTLLPYLALRGISMPDAVRNHISKGCRTNRAVGDAIARWLRG
jgi:hypothetical protein